MTENELNKLLTIDASGVFLVDYYPDDFEEMDDSTLEQFCKDNAWSPFEYWDGSAIVKLINAQAESTLTLLKRLASTVDD